MSDLRDIPRRGRSDRARCLMAVFVTVSATFWLSAVHADSKAPEAVVKRIVEQISHSLNEFDEMGIAGQRETLKLFRRELMPHLDTRLMAQYASAGHWDEADPTEQSAFVSALDDYLLSTYALLLTYGIKTGIKVQPQSEIRGSTASVAGTLEAYGKEPVKLQFRLVQKADEWKLFDVTANGVSTIKTLRAQFRAFAAVDGLASLTTSLTIAAQRPAH